jgi:hypothetical protein
MLTKQGGYMGIMDAAKGKMNDMADNMGDEKKERLNMLMHREQQGELTDSDRTELQRLREQMTGEGM